VNLISLTKCKQSNYKNRSHSSGISISPEKYYVRYCPLAFGSSFCRTILACSFLLRDCMHSAVLHSVRMFTQCETKIPIPRILPISHKWFGISTVNFKRVFIHVYLPIKTRLPSTTAKLQSRFEISLRVISTIKFTRLNIHIISNICLFSKLQSPFRL